GPEVSTGVSSGFEDALDDDLNISAALGFLFETINETNRALDLDKLNARAASSWLRWWERVNSVLAVEAPRSFSIPADIAALASARVQARLATDWRNSDELRDQLAEQGLEGRHTNDGQ